MKPEILYKFGRKDKLDLEELRRLVHSISRFLEPGEVQHLVQDGTLDALQEFVSAKRIGATHVLDGVWKRLGLTSVFERLLSARAFRSPIERLLFALVAQRAIDPGSKLSVEAHVPQFALSI